MLSRFGRWELPLQGASLKLVIATPPAGRSVAELIDPFLTVSDRGAFSRALLADVVGPGGDTIVPVVLKLQSDEYPLAVASTPGRLTNPEIEAAWGREVGLLEAAGSSCAGVMQIVEILERESGEPARLPPTFYCKLQNALFPTPCPSCGRVLADLRDDALLEGKGLPRFDRSLERYLACPSCLERGDAQLWTLVKDPDAPASDVGDQSDLVRAFRRLALLPPGPGEPAQMPCQGCPNVDACYPAQAEAGEAQHLLTPLTFFESSCLALPLYPLRYDEFVTLLGGGALDDVVASLTEAGRVAAISTLDPLLRSDRPGFFFDQDVAGKLGLEVLRLKLALFRELCEAVAAVHRHGRQPHLALTPQHALVRLSDRGRGQPALWGFAVGLLGLGNARVRAFRVGRASDLPAPPFQAPASVDPLFAAPPLRDPEPRDQPCVVTFQRLTRTPSSEVVVEALIESDTVDLSTIGDKDAITVSVVQARPPLSLSLLGCAVGSARGGMTIRSVPFPLGEQGRAQIEQLVGQRLSRARLTVHPCLNVPCDVHSLGTILATTLLANSEQDAAEVTRAVQAVGNGLQEVARQHAGLGLAELCERAATLLDAAAPEGPFSRRQLFHHPKRRQHAAAAVPEVIWQDALMVALRALTRIRGFSVCRSFSDFDPGHPEVNVEFLIQLVDTILRRVDSVLFGLPGRSREIRAAIARVAAELESGPEAMADERTRIIRAGRP